VKRRRPFCNAFARLRSRGILDPPHGCSHPAFVFATRAGLLNLARAVLAVDQETTLNALAVEAFNDLLKKHGKRQSVENPLLE
jgi:hypothetical protein